MNLPSQTAKALATGRATKVCVIQGTRREVKRKDWERRDRSATRWKEAWIPKIGAEESIQPKGKPSIGRVKILHAIGHRLADTTLKDARAMGFKTTAALREQWLRDHDAQWLSKHSTDNGELEPHAIEARFTQRWAAMTVWLVTVEVVEQQPRFMAPAPIAGKSGDYTHNPGRSIDPHAPCVDAAVQEQYSKTADAFCMGRKLARQKAMAEEQAAKKAERRPWAQAA